MANQSDHIEKIKDKQLDFTDSLAIYWREYSSYDTWQFWVCVAALVLPLIVLYFKIDRTKALLLGFYGYSIHIFFTYEDIIGANKTFWFYPYKILPVLSANLSLDISLIPVTYMLVYQWVIKNHKNYYLYMIALSAFFAFLFKPLCETLGLFQLDRGANYFHIFLAKFLVAVIAKKITDLFIHFEKKANI
ncbi:hypothetical protein DOE78_10510 [Bacillus sp. Y1]|nr:CBO0543 family protein [Bacillus sp. Y1]AYA75836.1 hypothetical protein DOE78_10510 [Bacillus sp. Y1]